MRKIALTIFCLVAGTGVAVGGQPPVGALSPYSPELQLSAYYEADKTYDFRGTIRLTGTLWLVFDMSAPDRANGHINFTKFEPDPEDVKKLPAVIGDDYPGRVTYVNLRAPLSQIISLFGGNEEFRRVSHGRAHEASRRATVVLKNYSAIIECDSRTYWGDAVSISSLAGAQVASGGEAPGGC
jgi:hypothetical protein